MKAMYIRIYIDTSVVPISLISVRVNALRFRGRRNGVSLLDIRRTPLGEQGVMRPFRNLHILQFPGDTTIPPTPPKIESKCIQNRVPKKRHFQDHFGTVFGTIWVPKMLPKSTKNLVKLKR